MPTIRAFTISALIVLFMLPLTDPSIHAAEVTITVDAAKQTGKVRRWERYQNNSLRHAPPVTLAAKVAQEYGRPAIMRSWLCLDDMWDYRTGEYRLNYSIGKDYYPGDTTKARYDRDRVTDSGVLYEDYLRSFSENCDEILLNVRRYEKEVVKGIITLEKWKEVLKTGLLHYKKLAPNLRYLEVLNEWQFPHFGGLTDDQYYEMYRVSYEAVNEVNAELKPKLPILVGGPSLFNRKGVPEFLANYAKDSSTAKRLDFISFHEYGTGGNPEAMATYKEWTVQELTKVGLPSDIAVFITEFGVGHPKKEPEYNLSQAAFITATQHAARNTEGLVLFPWVLFHAPIQVSLVQFTQDLKMTPYGFATKLQAMARENELAASSSAPSSKVGFLATGDAKGIVVKVWNIAKSPADVTVIVENLPPWAKDAKAIQYLVDSQNNNVFSNPDAGNSLSGTPVAGPWRVSLEPNAICQWTITAP